MSHPEPALTTDEIEVRRMVDLSTTDGGTTGWTHASFAAPGSAAGHPMEKRGIGRSAAGDLVEERGIGLAGEDEDERRRSKAEGRATEWAVEGQRVQ